ncbi:MAG: thioesterase family protein [Acidimicrobiales bacterium]|nr:thioesterase family protein [Acidimicrobiales bacterium]
MTTWLLDDPSVHRSRDGATSSTAAIGERWKAMFVHSDAATGEWIAIDSHATHTAGGIATGVAHLWDADGRPLATATQSALLRTRRGPT